MWNFAFLLGGCSKLVGGVDATLFDFSTYKDVFLDLKAFFHISIFFNLTSKKKKKVFQQVKKKTPNTFYNLAVRGNFFII